MATIRNASLTNSPSQEQVNHLKVTIPTAEVLTLNTVPVTIVPAPGEGKTIKVLSASAKIATYGGAAYATNLGLQIKTDTAGDAQRTNSVILSSTVARHLDMAPVASSGATSLQLVANKALQAFVATGNPATGTSDLILYVAYSIIED